MSNKDFLINTNIKIKYLIIPIIFFYIFDTIIIHENRGLLESKIPILHDILDFIYNFLTDIIYNDMHSKILSHTILFGFFILLSYFLIEKYNFFNLNEKQIQIKL